MFVLQSGYHHSFSQTYAQTNVIAKEKRGRMHVSPKKTRASSTPSPSLASTVLVIALLSFIAWREYSIWSPYLNRVRYINNFSPESS